MKDFFKESDFWEYETYGNLSVARAVQASNNKLRAHVEGLPLVRLHNGTMNKDKDKNWETISNPIGYPMATHTARLWDIQPIEKKACEHNFRSTVVDDNDYSKVLYYLCNSCGKKLKAKWEVAE